MDYKHATLTIYVLVGLLIVCIPIVSELLPTSSKYASPKQVSTIEPAPNAGKIALWAIGFVVGLIVSSRLVWWLSYSWTWSSIRQDLSLLLIGAIGLIFLDEARARDTERGIRVAKFIFLALAVAVVAPLSFSTGFIAAPQKLTAWHHWGAYIGPAELLLSGGRIFFDFPVQYGLGPTALIAAACGGNCMLGMYFVSAVMMLVFILLGLTLVATLRVRTILGAAAVLGATTAAFLLWTSFPPDASTSLTTPSVSGLRFLPVLALVCVLTWSEGHSVLSRRWTAVGWLAFTIAALWSPESLFISTLIWAPYYLLRRLADADPSKRLGRLFVEASTLVLTSVAIFACVLLTYRAYFGVWPDIEAFIGYILYPPGPMPINPRGPVPFFLAAFLIGVIACGYTYRARGNSSDFRRSFLLLLLAFGTFAYVLGRGHNNNFCNLLPYSVLVLCAALVRPLPFAIKGAAASMLASIVALLAFFGWASWYDVLKKGTLLTFEPRAALATWSYEDPVTNEQIRTPCKTCEPMDAVRALRQIRATSEDPIMILGVEHLSLPATSPLAWNAVHAPMNYASFPPEFRQRFLRRSMERFGRSGWLVIGKDLPSSWYNDFASVYKVAEEIDFGTYRAVHFVPQRP